MSETLRQTLNRALDERRRDDRLTGHRPVVPPPPVFFDYAAPNVAEGDKIEAYHTFLAWAPKYAGNEASGAYVSEDGSSFTNWYMDKNAKVDIQIEQDWIMTGGNSTPTTIGGQSPNPKPWNNTVGNAYLSTNMGEFGNGSPDQNDNGISVW